MSDKEFHANTTEHNPIPCRICGNMLSAATAVGTVGKPKTGLVSVCGHCGELSIFVVNALGTFLREPTLSEIAKFNRNYPGVVQRVIQHRADWERRQD